MNKLFERAAIIGLTMAILMTGCTSEKKASDTSADNLSESTSESESKEMVRLDLTEEEILNMSDEDFTEYGLLLIDHRIEDVQTPNPQREEFDFRAEDGYRYPGKPAKRSASDYSEALLIAAEEWQDNSDNMYGEVILLGENDKFWLFKCVNYYRGEFNMICTKAVYKKDYYDEETATANFELNEENIRTFFAYRSREEIDRVETCIGEFIIKTDTGYVFRRYSMYICYGDFGINDEVNLTKEEWNISNDGKMHLISDGFGRSLELPVSSIGDYGDYF